MESRESFDIDLIQYLLILGRRWLQVVSIFLLIMACFFFLTTKLKKSYEAGGKLLFKLDQTTSLVGLGNNELTELRPIVTNDNPLNTEIEVLSSYPLLKKTIDILQLKDQNGQPLSVDLIRKKITAKIIGGTDVVWVSYKSNDPAEAANVVNTLMKLYIQKNMDTKRQEAAEAGDFVAQQIPKTQEDVHKAEVELRKFKEENDIVALKNQAEEAVVVLRDFEIRISDIKSQLDQATSRAAVLRNQVDLNVEDAMVVSALSQSSGVQEVLKQLLAVETQLAQKRSLFQEQSPIILELKEQEFRLKGILQQQIKQVLGKETEVPRGLLQIGDLRQNLIKDFLDAEAQRISLKERFDSLENARTQFINQSSRLPKLEESQRELERKLEADQETYQTLLDSLKKIQVKANQETANARIIEEAKIPEKGSSGKAKILVLGMLFSGFASTATVLLLETRDQSVKTIQEARHLFKYPLVGLIPSFSKKRLSLRRLAESIKPDMPVIEEPYSLVSEMYRMMQANLKFLSSDKVIKTIVVTSSVPKEGKSTVAANLAATMAQLGRRILLVDADMRHPAQHHAWDLTNVAGLSEVLVGQTEFWRAVCQVMDNLDVLCGGVMPPNPLALLDSKRMATLIQEFSCKYDFVIFDAPPLILAADAVTLSQMTDGILLVARPGVVDYSSVKATQEILERSGENVLGLVVNGVIQKNESTRYFYHSQESVADTNAMKKRKQEAGQKKQAKLMKKS